MESDRDTSGGAAHKPLARDTVLVSLCTLLSRLTGFGRVVAAAAVLGNGLLGDTYQSANQLPNVLFELAAGGVLQAMLLPTLTDPALRDPQRMGRSVGVLYAWVGLGLAALAAALMLVSPIIARVLVASDPVAANRTEKLDVLVPMLLVFVPQIVFYGLGMVASAALAVRGRFVAAALAPAANNLVVIGACLWFRWSRDGAEASLDLSPGQFSIIAAGTTLGVAAFALAPVAALRGDGVRVQWRLDRSSRELDALKRTFGWASLTVGATFFPTLAALLLGNGAPGGIAVYVYAFAFFALPHALVAVPVGTTLAPRVAQRIRAEDLDGLREDLRRSWSVMAPALCVAAAGLACLAWPGARAAAFGQTASQGIDPIAHALIAFAPGLVTYGVSFVLLRLVLAAGDLRACAQLMVLVGVVGVFVMAGCALVAPSESRAAALAAGYGLTQLLAAIVLARRLHRLTGGLPLATMARPLIEGLVAAAAAGAAMVAVVGAFGTSRPDSAMAVVVGGAAGVGAAVVALVALRRGKLLAG